MTTATLTETPVLNRDDYINRFHDRCDRCGAEAFVVVEKKVRSKSLRLVFCGHHGTEHRKVLDKKKWVVIDFTWMINQKPSTSANKD